MKLPALVRQRRHISELYHYNENHDPRNGQFTTSKGCFRAGLRKQDTVTTGVDLDLFFPNEKAKLSNPLDRTMIERTPFSLNPGGKILYPPVARAIEYSEETGRSNPFPGKKGFDGLYDRVNPNYGAPGTTNNCPFVGATMEIASRGYNVVSRRSLGGASASCFERWFVGAKNELCSSWDELRSDISSYGDGSSGVVQGYYGDGLGSGMGGHTLHWRNQGGQRQQRTTDG